MAINLENRRGEIYRMLDPHSYITCPDVVLALEAEALNEGIFHRPGIVPSDSGFTFGTSEVYRTLSQLVSEGYVEKNDKHQKAPNLRTGYLAGYRRSGVSFPEENISLEGLTLSLPKIKGFDFLPKVL